MRYPNPIQSQMQAFSVSSMTRGITGKFFPVIAPTIEPQKPKPRAEAVIPRRRLRSDLDGIGNTNCRLLAICGFSSEFMWNEIVKHFALRLRAATRLRFA